MEHKSSEHLKDEALVAVLTAAVAVYMDADESEFTLTGIKEVANKRETSAWSRQGLKNLMASRL